MYLTDYHTHTRCSPDGEATLSEMVQAARDAGLRELCTTDHLDIQTMEGGILGDWDWGPILRQYAGALPGAGDLKLLLGIELGGAHVDPARAEQLLEGIPLDYVIGSVHNTSMQAGNQDFYDLDYTDEAYSRAVLEDYVNSLLALAPLSTYDALGHIIYPLRYINGRGGHHLTIEPWHDQIDAVLRTVIDSGRAIEFNTHNGEELLPWFPVLDRYRELGGEYITLGSDAHRAQGVGRGLARAAEILREKGYRWLTLYEKRRPRQVPL